MRASADSEIVHCCGGSIRPTYMKEFGSHVWQPEHPQLTRLWSVEPFVHLEEAKAFLRGVDLMARHATHRKLDEILARVNELVES